MTKKELIDKWSKEKSSLEIGELNNLHVKYYTTKSIREIGEMIISMFIDDLKNLSNEPKVVRNNEQKEKYCHHAPISHIEYCKYGCNDCSHYRY